MRHCLLGWLTVAVLFAPGAWGQEYRATLTGQVTDSAGAAMVNVKIVAKLESTGAEFTTASGPTGAYTLPFLPPGTYTVSAENAGFKRYVNETVVLSAGSHVTLNISMDVGVATQSVTVSADASILTTASASVAQAIPSTHMEDMPSIGGAAMSMAALAVGVIDLTNPQANERPFDNAGTSRYAMGGGSGITPNGSNELLLDGAPNMWGPQNRQVAYNPPLDTVEEVKVELFMSDAAVGDALGGAVTIVTKGGTSQFHGTLKEFNQLGTLAASPFFSNAVGGRKVPTEYNQYGVTVTGPLEVPKLLKVRNKVFWSFSYEGIKHRQPQPTVKTVPTAAMRQGDFSALLSLGSTYTIYDPRTGVAQAGRVARQAFPGNKIPANRFSSVALNYLAYYPLPNLSSNASGVNDYLAASSSVDNYFTVLPRLDFVISDRHKLFWNYHAVYRTQYVDNFFGNISTGDTRPRDGNGSTLDDLYAFNSSMFLNTRLSWNRLVNYEYRDATLAGFSPTSLGFPASIAAASPKLTIPYLLFSDSTQALGQARGNTQGAGFYTPYDSYQIFSALNKIKGSHALKFGADLRMSRQSTIVWGNSAGSYSFDSSWVNGPYSNSAAAPQGQAFAAFLLGQPSGGSFDLNSHTTAQSYYTAFFMQDDWRIRPNLTINMGLRYDHETPAKERYNRALDGFDFISANSVTNAARVAYAANPIPQLPASQFNPVGGATYASASRPDIASTYNFAFSPRFGFAYTPSGPGGKTVIRGGFGIFFSTYGVAGAGTGNPQAPMGAYSQSTPVVASLDGFQTPYATLSNPFPTGFLQPTGAATGLNTALGQSVNFLNPTLAQPYSERWTVTIQRELTPSLLLELGYIGNRSLHLPMDLSLDGIPAQFLSRSAVRDIATINALSANVANPLQGLLPGTTLNGSTMTVAQLLQPFPEFVGATGLLESYANAGSSDFHSLNVRVQKRFSKGLQLISSYQHSRLMSAVTQLNSSLTTLARMVDTADRPNRFVCSFVYDLPFGRGKVIGTQSAPWLDRLVGGWELSGIATIQSGAPLSWGNVIYLGGDPKLNAHNPDGAFGNPNVFNRVSAQALGNYNLRTFPQYFNNLRQDDVKNFSSAVTKTFPIHERLRLRFRGEAFNTLNRTQFAAPNRTPTNSAFGTITSQVNSPRTIQFSLRLVW